MRARSGRRLDPPTGPTAPEAGVGLGAEAPVEPRRADGGDSRSRRLRRDRSGGTTAAERAQDEVAEGASHEEGGGDPDITAGADEESPGPAAPSLVRIGMVVWLSSELMFFSGLFAAYYFLRGADAEWPPEGVELGTERAGLFTAILVLSSGTMHLAGHRSESGDERGTRRWTILTIVLGAAFLLNQLAEYAELEFFPTDHAYGSLFYLMTGFHGAHVFGGLGLLAALLIVATGRTSKAPLASTMSVATYYWHFVDVVWVAMFATVYLVR